jgi:hypothetical protein
MSRGHDFKFEKMVKRSGEDRPTYPDSINFTIPEWKAWNLIREILGQLQGGKDVISFSGCGLLTHDEED